MTTITTILRLIQCTVGTAGRRASSLLHVRGTAAVSAVVNLINDTAPVSLSSAYCLCVGHVFTKFTDATSNNALPTGLNCSLACILF